MYGPSHLHCVDGVEEQLFRGGHGGARHEARQGAGRRRFRSLRGPRGFGGGCYHRLWRLVWNECGSGSGMVCVRNVQGSLLQSSA